MKRSKRMGTVLMIAEQRRKEAEQRFGAAQHQLQQERDKLAQLQTYLADYQSEMAATGSRSMTQLQRMQAFMAKLQQALEQQKQQIALCELNVQHRRAQWQAADGKTKAIGSLQERLQAEEQQAEDKQLQRLIDEMQMARRGR